MSIIGLGVDVVEVARVRAMLARHPDRFLERVFTAGEVAHSAGRRNRAQHLAARFAAKEAAMKALGTGLSSGIGWQDVEVIVEASGKPALRLHGAARMRARALGAQTWSISLSHTRAHAAAVVVGEGTPAKAGAKRRPTGARKAR